MKKISLIIAAIFLSSSVAANAQQSHSTHKDVDHSNATHKAEMKAVDHANEHHKSEMKNDSETGEDKAESHDHKHKH